MQVKSYKNWSNSKKEKGVTFGDVNVEFKVIDVEAPEEAGDEVK